MHFKKLRSMLELEIGFGRYFLSGPMIPIMFLKNHFDQTGFELNTVLVMGVEFIHIFAFSGEKLLIRGLCYKYLIISPFEFILIVVLFNIIVQ